MILGALADFYEVRKDPTYLEQAYRIAQACIAYNSRDGILWERGRGTRALERSDHLPALITLRSLIPLMCR